MALNPYWNLVRSNQNFRRLWIGSIASFLGDWFNTIALYTLVRQLTESELALGVVFITKVLPFAIASPLAGLLTDRFNRRRLMIWTDLLRAAVVLGLLMVNHRDQLPLLYMLVAVQMMISAVFIPARSAAIPNITTNQELVTANTLSAATWSMLLAMGAALGGLATAWLGIKVVFMLDSFSYLVSAWFIYRTVIPQSTDSPRSVTRHAFQDIVAGWRYMWHCPQIGRMAFAKATWLIGGGGLVYMLALVGEQLWSVTPAIGIGLLYAARGLGSGIGPILARAWIPNEQRWPNMIGFGVILTGVVYIVIAQTPWNWWWVGAAVTLAHAPSGANWVFSTVLLQRRTEDRFRGRVFATEWLLLTIADTLAVLIASLALQSGVIDLRGGIALFAGIQIACGIGWILLIVPGKSRHLNNQEV